MKGRVFTSMAIAIAIILAINLAVLISFLGITKDARHPHANIAEGTIMLCINTYTTFNLSCAAQINQSTSLVNNTYFCQLPTTDQRGYALTYTYDPPELQQSLEFSLTSAGLLRINGGHSTIGPYTSVIIGSDNVTGCPANHTVTYAFEILDINDPPRLVTNVPSRNMQKGITASLFFLDDYFSDYDGDVLRYTVTGVDNFVVDINTASSEVVVANPDGNCDSDNIYFTAYDPENLSAYSNFVTLNSLCPEEVSTSTGGGGGGSSFCEPEWQCGSWSQCYPNSTRERTCADLNACDLNNLKKVFWEACEYIPSCYDGVQNQGETGIDCGGPCPVCQQLPSCYDGIQNQNEEGVDCGGPCDACVFEPTCFDGVQNQGETGVDCGGPCAACKELQTPGLIPEEANSLLSTAALITLLVIFGAVLYLVFRKEIRSIYAKVIWWMERRKRKQILISANVRKDLLEALELIEKSFALKREKSYFSTEDFMQKLLQAYRYYFMNAASLPAEFSKEDLDAALSKKVTNRFLLSALGSLFDKVRILETKKMELSKLHVALVLEELRQVVLSTSEYSREDLNFSAREMRVKGSPIERTVQLIHNAMLALQFNEIESAKKNYLALLGVYEELDDASKTLVYSDVSRVYNYVTYQVSWV